MPSLQKYPLSGFLGFLLLREDFKGGLWILSYESALFRS